MRVTPQKNPRCKDLVGKGEQQQGCWGPAGIHPVLSKLVLPPKVRLLFPLNQVALQLFPQ